MTYLDVADLVADESAAGFTNVAVTLAVLAGIAASDAICCARLGRRSRSQDHRVAEDLLKQVEPDGKQASENLRRLLDQKDAAQYGLASLGQERVKGAIRQARLLVRIARESVAG